MNDWRGDRVRSAIDVRNSTVTGDVHFLSRVLARADRADEGAWRRQAF